MSVSAHDVTTYILREKEIMTAMKLQKLLYYCQAWSLVWDERPLFTERIEAWASGPVVREIYNKHQGMFIVSTWNHGKISNLNKTQKETIDAIIKYYGNKTSQWLSDLTHKEAPWENARIGLRPTQRGNKTITHANMMEYYSSLAKK